MKTHDGSELEGSTSKWNISRPVLIGGILVTTLGSLISIWFYSVMLEVCAENSFCPNYYPRIDIGLLIAGAGVFIIWNAFVPKKR